MFTCCKQYSVNSGALNIPGILNGCMYIFFANTKLVSHIPCVSIDDVSYDAISYYIREKEELEFEWFTHTDN